MSVKVKICGITSISDAATAAEAGADALGFMFFEPSPRHLKLSVAADIIRQLPPFVARVGVFVNPQPDIVRRAVEECGIDYVQLHGEEPPDFCAKFSVPVIKAFRIQNGDSLAQLHSYRTSAWLLDSFVAGKSGGTGESFNWDLAARAKHLGRPVILAGGLTPENVSDAVKKVRPYGVDVSSGVELAPGKKDRRKVTEFIERAKAR